MKHRKIYLTPEHYETAKKNGIRKETLEQRVYRYRWDIEKAITKPARTKKSHGKWPAVARENGVPLELYYNRTSDGWSMEKAATTKVGKLGRQDNREYAIYKGDEFLFAGNAVECAAFLGIKVDSVRQYATPSYVESVNQETSIYAIVIEGDNDEANEIISVKA